ncbi:hypothetical protein C8R47DRAFT_1221831 [Mycena vitilis]|nr:hypothetical protein C8R47DRAFT_1221831 [Mycena vitilis]
MSETDTHPSFDAIHAKLVQIIGGYSNPTERNVDALLGAIASCGGRYNNIQLIKIWRGKFGTARDEQLFEELVDETISGRKQYLAILDCYTNPGPGAEMSDEAFDLAVNSFLTKLRPELEKFIRSENPLPLWVPAPESPYAEFLTAMKIPVSQGGRPDMVLHDLGSFERDPELDARLNEIFLRYILDGTIHNILVLNTSGSGKTKLMLEGLCKYWGFYFTCRVDAFGHGSTDLQNTITSRIAEDEAFRQTLPPSNPLRTAVAQNNSLIATARLRELLVARLFIFTLFCDIIGGSLTDAHKRLWVLLQLRPTQAAKGFWDIFDSLTQRIQGMDEDYRDNTIRSLTEDLHDRLARKRDDPPFFIVIDEVQAAASGEMSLAQAFTSTGTEPGRKYFFRPIAREIARHLVIPGLPLALNITGTSLDKHLIEDILSTRILKDRATSTIKDIGAFSTLEQQRKYLERRMPPIFAQRTVEMNAFFTRAFRWLRGRYRFTAMFLQELMARNFERPHEVLSSYVMRCTQVPLRESDELSAGFSPSDGDRFLNSALKAIEKWDTFDFMRFDNMKPDSNILLVLSEFVRRYWMRSHLEAFPVTDGQYKLVVAGFARYSKQETDGRDIVSIDEPLAVLALIEWLRICHVPFSEGLRTRAAVGVTESTGVNGLEEYLAFYFSAVFDDHTPLDAIFKFSPEHTPQWAKQPARLVSLFRDQNEIQEGRVQEYSRPSVCLGTGGGGKPNTFKWLKHESPEPFCFPDQDMGPDIIFILKLRDKDESLIWVAVQSKFNTGKGMFPVDKLHDTLVSVIPANFYSKPPVEKETKKKKESANQKDAEKKQTKEEATRKAKETAALTRKINNQAVLELIDALPRRLSPALQKEGAGLHSVLRVIVAWPGHPSLHERSDASSLKGLYEDEEQHPVVEINQDHWGSVMDRLHPATEGFIRSATVYFEAGNKKRVAVGDQRALKRTKLGNRSAADVLKIDEFPAVEPARQLAARSEVSASRAGSVNTYGSPPPVTEMSDDSPFLSPVRPSPASSTIEPPNPPPTASTSRKRRQ